VTTSGNEVWDGINEDNSMKGAEDARLTSLSVAAISIQDGRLSSIVWVRVFAVESDCKTPL